MKNNEKSIWEKLAKNLQTAEEFERFFGDLLTPREFYDLQERIKICQELAAGKTVKEVCEKLGVASATVVRGNRVMKYGSDFVRKMFRG